MRRRLEEKWENKPKENQKKREYIREDNERINQKKGITNYIKKFYVI